MNKKLLALIVVAGFVGGALSTGVLRSTTVFAISATESVKEVKAEKFILVDEFGTHRAFLGFAKGNPILGFLAPNGNARVGVGLGLSGEPTLSFYDANLQPRMFCAMSTDGSATIALLDKNEVQRLGLQVLANNQPLISLFDRQGNPRAAIAVMENGHPAIALYDQNQRPFWDTP